MSNPTTTGEAGIKARINIGGHDYMLVSEHYAILNTQIARTKPDKPTTGEWELWPVVKSSGELWLGLATISYGERKLATLNAEAAKALLAAIKAALDAEREKVKQWLLNYDLAIAREQQLREQLATASLRLAAAQAAINVALKWEDEGDTWRLPVDVEEALRSVDLSALDAAIAEAVEKERELLTRKSGDEPSHEQVIAAAQQPLVDALNGMLGVYEELHARYDLGDCQATVDARDALAKVKEGK